MNLYFTTKNLTDNYGLLNTCNNILFVFGRKKILYTGYKRKRRGKGFRNDYYDEHINLLHESTSSN